MINSMGRGGVDPVIFGKPIDGSNVSGGSENYVSYGDINPVEKNLIQFFKKELGISEVKTVSHLQDLGANSFHMVRLASQLFDVYRIQIPLETILKSESLFEIASRIEREIVLTIGHLSDAARYAIWDQALHRCAVTECDKTFQARYPDTPSTVLETAWLILSGALAGKPSAIPKRRNRGRAKLSPSQLRLWEKTRSGPLRPSLNLAFSFNIKGQIDVAGLGDAVQELTRRHDILRVVFVEEDGKPMQKILDEACFKMPVISFMDVPSSQRAEKVESWLVSEGRLPFTMGASPLFRINLLRLAHHHHILSVVVSRLIFDEWSINLFAKELSHCYNAGLMGQPEELATPPVQFPDVAEWQAGRTPEVRKHPFWRELLAGELPITSLQSGGVQAPRKLKRSQCEVFSFSRPLTKLLRAMARQHGATLFQILLASFKTWIYKHTGQTDLIIGTVSANRKKQGLEFAMGPLASTLALRTQLIEDADFETTLRHIARVCIHGVEFEDIPLERALAAANMPVDPERLFDIRMLFRNHEQFGLNLENALCEPAAIYHGNAGSSTQLEFLETDHQINVYWYYDADRFQQEAVQGYIQQFLALTEKALLNPNQSLKGLTLG